MDDDYTRFDIERLALTKEQIRKYDPPPNPAKFKDPRSGAYIQEHGAVSWEVDALPPKTLNRLVVTAIQQVLNQEAYENSLEKEKEERQQLQVILDGME